MDDETELTSQEMREIAAALDDMPTFPDGSQRMPNVVATPQRGRPSTAVPLDGESESKRQRATDQDLEGLRTYVDTTRAEVTRVLAAVQQNLSVVGKTFNTHCSNLDKQMEQRFGQIREKIGEQGTNISKMQSAIHELRQLLGTVRAEKPEATSTAASGGGSFERKTDSTIVVLRNRDPVPKQNALTCFVPVLEAASIEPTSTEIEGDPISKRFQIRFKGAAGYATRRVNQTLSAMRAIGPNPGWMQLTAKTASGGDTPLQYEPLF